MKERFTTIKLFLIRHFFVVGLVLLFLVLSLCSCGRATADSMIQSDREFLHDYFGDGFTSDQWDYIEGVMDSCPYFITFQTSDGSKKAVALMPYSSYYTYDDIYGSNDLTVPDLEIQISINNVGHDINLGTEYGRLCPYGLGNISSSSTDNPYCYYTFGIGQEVNAIGLCVVPSGQWYDDSSTWHCRWYYSSRRPITGFDSHSIANWDYDTSLVNCNYNARVIRGSYTITETYPQNVFPVEYVSDERLKLSTSLRGDGEKLLNTDLSDFLHWNDEGDTQSVYNVSLTLDCDGTQFVVPLDSNNSEVVFTRNMSNYSYRCVYITPFSELGLDEFDDVTIIKCDFNRVTVNPNAIGFDEEFKIACNYILKNETAPIEPDTIEHDDDTETIKVSTAEITAKDEVVNMQNYYYSYIGGGGQELVIPEGFTVKIITCVDNTSLADAINQLVSWRLLYNSFGAFYDIGEAAFLEVTSISNSDDFLVFMEDEINNNSYGDYYDIVCYYYCPDVSSSEVDQFYYYITSSGKLRTVNQTLADIWVECNQTSYNTAAIYDFLYTRLNDFEDKSLEAFNGMIALDRLRNTWLSTLNIGISSLNQTSYNGFVDVVNAINNIDIPQPVVFDDSDILDKLDSLIDLVQGLIDGNEVDTPQDCIQYFYDNQNGTVDLAFLPAYYEGMTLDFLYSIQGETQNNLRSGTKSGGGPAVLVNNSLLIQIFNQFKDSFTDNFISQNIRVFLSNITNDTGNHMYYFQLFHNDYDPEDFDGLAY